MNGGQIDRRWPDAAKTPGFGAGVVEVTFHTEIPMRESGTTTGKFECGGNCLQLVWWGKAEPYPYKVSFVFGGEERIVTNHYFGMTDEIAGTAPSEGDTMLRLLSLLLQTWRKCVGRLEHQQSCLLLYGFDDGGIEAALANLVDETLELQFGRLDREFYHVNPSETEDFCYAFDLFEVWATSTTVQLPRTGFVEDLLTVISCVNAHR